MDDTEMDYHSYVVFVKFLEGLRRTHKLVMVGF